MIHCTWSAIYNGSSIDGPCSSIFHHAKWPESSAQSNCKTVINNPLLKRFTNFHLSNGLMCDITLRHVAKGKSISVNHDSWRGLGIFYFAASAHRTRHLLPTRTTPPDIHMESSNQILLMIQEGPMGGTGTMQAFTLHCHHFLVKALVIYQYNPIYTIHR